MLKKRNVWLGAICLLLMLGCLLSSCTGKTAPRISENCKNNGGECCECSTLWFFWRGNWCLVF